MKVIAINGSSRINGNTAELLTQALRGAAEAGADTELIHLRPLNYRGAQAAFIARTRKIPMASAQCGMTCLRYWKTSRTVTA